MQLPKMTGPGNNQLRYRKPNKLSRFCTAILVLLLRILENNRAREKCGEYLAGLCFPAESPKRYFLSLHEC